MKHAASFSLTVAAVAQRLLPEGELRRQFELQGSSLNGNIVPFQHFPDSYVQAALQEGKDWRDDPRGVVQSVKNQGPHGFCGTFGRVGAVEGQYALRSGQPSTSFSVQQLVDCVGWDQDQVPAILGLEGAKTRGLERWEDYPYDKSNYPDADPPVDGHPCQFDISKVPTAYISPNSQSGGFTAWTRIPGSEGEDQAAAFLHHNGPIQGGINADVFNYLDNDSFIGQDACDKVGQSIDHSVLFVGYGEDAQKGLYWLIKNSWGPDWADGGFVKVVRGVGCAGIGEIWDGVPVYGSASGYYIQSEASAPSGEAGAFV